MVPCTKEVNLQHHIPILVFVSSENQHLLLPYPAAWKVTPFWGRTELFVIERIRARFSRIHSSSTQERMEEVTNKCAKRTLVFWVRQLVGQVHFLFTFWAFIWYSRQLHPMRIQAAVGSLEYFWSVVAHEREISIWKWNSTRYIRLANFVVTQTMPLLCHFEVAATCKAEIQTSNWYRYRTCPGVRATTHDPLRMKKLQRRFLSSSLYMYLPLLMVNILLDKWGAKCPKSPGTALTQETMPSFQGEKKTVSKSKHQLSFISFLSFSFWQQNIIKNFFPPLAEWFVLLPDWR